MGYEVLEPGVQVAVQASIEQVHAKPNVPPARLQLAITYHGNDLPNEAMLTYQQILDLDPDAARAWYGLALIHDRAGNPEEALKALQEVRSLAPSYVPAIWKAGYIHLESGRINDAIKAFNETLKISSQDPAARTGLARAALADGRPADAARVLESLRQQLSNSYLDFLLGQSYRRLGREDEAAMLLAKVQGDPPRFNDPWQDTIINAGASYEARIDHVDRLIQSGAYREALEKARTTMEQKPDDLPLLHRISQIQALQGQNEQAVRTLKRALRVDDMYAPTHLNLSIRYQVLKNMTLARRHAARAVELNPKMGEAHLQFARLALADDNIFPAATAMDRAFEYGIQDPESRLMYAHVLTRTGRFDEAQGQYMRVLELDRNRGICWAGLADIHLLRNDLVSAAETIQEGLARAPDDPQVQKLAQLVKQRILQHSREQGGKP